MTRLHRILRALWHPLVGLWHARRDIRRRRLAERQERQADLDRERRFFWGDGDPKCW